MSKKKLQKFAEMETFDNVFQYNEKGIIYNDYELKGLWNKLYFKNENPIVLELGCGKGEYTIALAEQNKDINYIGVDIKGARIWRGAKTANEKKIPNIAFLRTKIENITRFFAPDEVSEIWIPFPDPQPKKPRKRLTSNIFLSYYQKIMINNGIVHLKTDNIALHEYTIALLNKNNISSIDCSADIYGDKTNTIVTRVQTFYEKMFLAQDMKITYLNFKLDNSMLIEPPDEDNFS